MTEKIADLPIVGGIFLIVVAAIAAIVIMVVTGHAIDVPSELKALPGVGLGALAGSYMAMRKTNPQADVVGAGERAVGTPQQAVAAPTQVDFRPSQVPPTVRPMGPPPVSQPTS